jgi:hypothetical protein|tara:strand:- start:354 stop:923 length:570 start_codon:yes stop_codon:yes gene_type:complete
MNSSKPSHLIKRALQALAVLSALALGFQEYSEYAARVAYDETPQGKAKLAAKMKNRDARESASARSTLKAEALRLTNIEAAAERRSEHLEYRLAKTKTAVLSSDTETEADIGEAKSDTKMQACSNQRMQEYAYGKQALQMSLKDPGSFEQHGLPKEYGSSYEIIYSSTNIYGGRVRSTHSIPVTNCVYE